MYGGDIAAIGGVVLFLGVIVLWFRTTEGR